MCFNFCSSQEELEEKLNYSNAPIYVRKLTGSEKYDDPDFPGLHLDDRITNSAVSINGRANSEVEQLG